MAAHADTPFDFCRAEVYAGTPLKAALERDDRLQGDYLAWSYEMRRPRVELLFRIASTAFARWTSAEVRNLVGITLVSIDVPDQTFGSVP